MRFLPTDNQLILIILAVLMAMAIVIDGSFGERTFGSLMAFFGFYVGKHWKK